MTKSNTKSILDKYKEAIAAGKGTVALADLDSGGIGSIQCRAAINHEVVADYAALMTGEGGRGSTSEQFPAVRIFQVEDALYLTAGSHRCHAAKQARKDCVDADFFTGTYFEALLDAVTSNAKHGLRPNRADIRNSLHKLFEHAQYRKQSDNQLAKLVGCSPTTVGTVRKQLKGADDGKRVGSDGREQNTKRIGKKAKLPKAPLSKLDSENDDEPPLCPCDNGPVVDGERCQSCIDHDRSACQKCAEWTSCQDGLCAVCLAEPPEVQSGDSDIGRTEAEQSRMRSWNNALEKVARACDEAVKAIQTFAKSPSGDFLDKKTRGHLNATATSTDDLAAELRVLKGYKACPKCGGAGTSCHFCSERGFVNSSTFKSLGGE